jgi:hypothetical protein
MTSYSKSIKLEGSMASYSKSIKLEGSTED